MLKKHTIQATPEAVDLLGQLFRKNNGTPNPTGGCGYIVDAFRSLYRQTLIKIKGQFSQGEIFLMIDVVNGLMLTPQIAGQHILANVADGIALDRLEIQHNIGGPELIKKLEAISIPERALLELWLKGFWEQHGTSKSIPLEEYIKPLLE